jgi:hypothetical protein
MIKRSESIKEIAKALIVFHGVVNKIAKTEDNPFFKSKYAGLPSILEAIKEPLVKSGLIFTQLPHGKDKLTSLVIHPESGEFLESTIRMTPVKADPQALGSAISYARRYSLVAILGLNVDEDDDGNAASTPAAKQSSPQTAKPPVERKTPTQTVKWTQADMAGMAMNGFKVVKKEENKWYLVEYMGRKGFLTPAEFGYLTDQNV